MMVFMFWATSYPVIRPIIVRLNGILGRCIAVRFVIRPPVWSGIIASLGTQISQLFRAVSESVIRLGPIILQLVWAVIGRLVTVE